MKGFKVALTVNNKPIKLIGFPKDYVTLTLAGAASSLKGVEEIEKLDLTMKFGKVKLSINGSPISLKPFPTIILARTLIAISSTLKGVEGDVVSLEIQMQTE